MKNMILISLCVLFTSSALCAEHRSNALLRFVARENALSRLGLYVVMEERCYKYLPKSEAKLCSESSKRTLALLDFDIVMSENDSPALLDEENPESFVFVAFKKEFLRLLADPKVESYLTKVHESLNRFLIGQDLTPINLWEITVQHFGSEKMAALIMATLFQDTSPNKLHLAWLEKKNINGSILFTHNKEKLERIIDTVNFIMDTTETHYRRIFYPRSLHKTLNRNIYHFYVPMYLASQIQQSGMRKEHAVMGPLMMTLSYEFITSAPDLRYLYKDPANLTDQTHLDIFAGYAGGRLGTNTSLQSFEMVRQAFLNSTQNGVKSLLSF